jgi:hypothetical protein
MPKEYIVKPAILNVLMLYMIGILAPQTVWAESGAADKTYDLNMNQPGFTDSNI